MFKPDLASYNKQRAAADGASSALVGSSAALAASEDLYRDANSFVYADHKPSEDAIDRVIGKINLECVPPPPPPPPSCTPEAKLTPRPP